MVAANVLDAMNSRGVTMNMLSNAADVPASKLSGGSLTWGELQNVSGVLGVSPADLFREVPSV